VPLPDREEYTMLVKYNVKYIVRYENLVILAIKEWYKERQLR